MEGLTEKRRRLREILRECGSVLVAYSGGVDSVFLAHEAVETLGRGRVLAVTGTSPSVAAAQRETARSVAEEFGLPWRPIVTRELEDGNYAANPANRCYFCKAELFRRLAEVARRRGLATVVDGTNADDAGDHRPGTRAARGWSVRSPLQEAGFTKEEIRRLSREAGLPTWDLPASPCLASRLPYGVAVTPERLRQVEAAERALRALGVKGDLRVRHHAGVARLELSPEEMARWARPSLCVRTAARLRPLGFRRVVLDLEGYRRGSLNRGAGGAGGRPPGVGAAGPGPATWRGLPEAPAPFRVPAGPRAGLPGLEPEGPEGEIGVARVAGPELPGLLSPGRRRRLVALARRAGFRYAALDLDLRTG